MFSIFSSSEMLLGSSTANPDKSSSYAPLSMVLPKSSVRLESSQLSSSYGLSAPGASGAGLSETITLKLLLVDTPALLTQVSV